MKKKSSSGMLMLIVMIFLMCVTSSAAAAVAAFVWFDTWWKNESPAPAPFLPPSTFGQTQVAPATSPTYVAVPSPQIPPPKKPDATTPPKKPESPSPKKPESPSPKKPDATTPPKKPEQPPDAMARIFLEGHNVIRRQRGISPEFSWDPALANLARINAEGQVRIGRYGHQSYMANLHGTGTTYPENGFVGTPTPGWTAHDLSISPGHMEHVLGANVSKVGCAFVPGRVRGGGPQDNNCAWDLDESPGHPCNQGQNICFYDAWGPKLS
jgi:uncharacterized protein YkwD